MTIRPMFAWYDFWVGAFVDRAKRRLYVFPLPMVGFVIQWPVVATGESEGRDV